ncbi:MAG: hypothetical protein AB7J13_04460 [Pyrinomonadaceae bacterium]
MRKRVLVVTGAPVSILDTPKPLEKTTLSPLMTATAPPGVFVCFSSLKAAFSSSTNGVCAHMESDPIPIHTIAIKLD